MIQDEINVPVVSYKDQNIYYTNINDNEGWTVKLPNGKYCSSVYISTIKTFIDKYIDYKSFNRFKVVCVVLSNILPKYHLIGSIFEVIDCTNNCFTIMPIDNNELNNTTYIINHYSLYDNFLLYDDHNKDSMVLKLLDIHKQINDLNDELVDIPYQYMLHNRDKSVKQFVQDNILYNRK